jgi:hypothetical protein
MKAGQLGLEFVVRFGVPLSFALSLGIFERP